jgi:hypothetical protein
MKPSPFLGIPAAIPVRMMNFRSLNSILAATATFAAVTASAQSVSPVQAKAQPFGLPLAGPVMVAATDDASNQFQKEVLPTITKLVSQTLGETKKFDDSSLLLDPSKLKLQNAADLRVYFVGEGAGFRNTLGYNTGAPGIKGGDPTIIFPDASTQVAFAGTDVGVKRTQSEPLAAGDFVQLGKFDAGTKLDFFLIADGANKGKTVFSTTTAANPDGINHVVSFVTAFSSYLLIGFEDLTGGGDRDFNDLVFAIDIGAANIAALTATPEPGTWLTLGSFLGAGVWMARRRQATKA